MESLIEIANKIMAGNRAVLLSGSLALRLQGIKTKREPVDLDFFMPYPYTFRKIDGMKKSYEDCEDDYENEDYIRECWIMDGVKIDVFSPIENIDLHVSYVKTFNSEIKCVNHVDIVKFKLSHAFDDKESRFKHKDDLIYILEHNII